MKRTDLRVIGLVVVIGAVVCAVAYAGKCKKKKPKLPAAAKAAVKALYPKGEIEEVEVEKEGIKLYEVELEQNGKEYEVAVTADGNVVEVETEIGLASLPPRVRAAITEAAEGGKVGEVTKEVTYAVVKLVVLDKPVTSYEAEVVKDGSECEIEVAANGTVLEKSKWESDDDDHDDDAHGHDDDDKK